MFTRRATKNSPNDGNARVIGPTFIRPPRDELAERVAALEARLTGGGMTKPGPWPAERDLDNAIRTAEERIGKLAARVSALEPDPGPHIARIFCECSRVVRLERRPNGFSFVTCPGCGTEYLARTIF